MKVIGFSCSPRKGGNTDILVKQVLGTINKIGAEIEFLRISDLRISHCRIYQWLRTRPRGCEKG